MKHFNGHVSDADPHSAGVWPKATVKVAGSLALLIGVTVLVGWALDIARLKSVLPGFPKMAALTAFLFVVAGAGLWALISTTTDALAEIGTQTAANRWLPRSCGGVLLVFGALRLSIYLLGLDLSLDQLGFHEALSNGPPARMAPATAVGFTFLGGGLLLASTSRFARAFQALVLLSGLIGWLGIGHYLYGGRPLLPYAPMAIHTALSFLILSAGVLCARPGIGLVALLLSNSAGGTLARRLVPSALILPVVLGWLRLQGQRAGWYGTEAGITLFALVNVVVFGGLIWANAALLDRSDWERKIAESKVRAQLERLKLLDQITRGIGERQDLRSIYQVVLHDLEESPDFDFGLICDYDSVGKELTVRQAGNSSRPLALELGLTENANIPLDGNGLSRCVTGQLVYEPDIASVKMPFTQKLAAGGLRSLVIAPMQVESKVFGVFVAARRKAHGFSSGDCELLKQLTEHVALAAQQAELYRSLQGAYEDLRETQQAVMQQERLRVLGQMASGIAHDINNALSPIALYTESILDNEKSLSDKGRRQLETVQRAIDDAARTVARMKEFYRQREPQLTLTPVDINALVRQVVDISRARWSDMPQQRGVMIEMRTELSPDLPAVMGVESEIREALVNLIFNAVDAMPVGGTLTLRTRETAATAGQARVPFLRTVCVEVVDTGVGMDEQTRVRCAEPFFTTKGERGTGLGLAMVYGTTKRHGAELEIESAVGKGTTVRLSFAAPTAIPPGVVRPDRMPVVSAPMRILVIDDDAIVAKSLRETLEADGHSVFTANGGGAGIEAFHTSLEIGEGFDVVITDLGMPYVDGRKVAKGVKDASPLTPVILLTGWGQRLVAEGDVPAHADHVLSKPPKLLELRATLALCWRDRTQGIATTLK